MKMYPPKSYKKFVATATTATLSAEIKLHDVYGIWILHFENGDQMCMTEEAYEEFMKKTKTATLISKIVCEEHWFDKRKAKEKYSWLD